MYFGVCWDKKQKHTLDMFMSAFWHLCYYNGSNKTHFGILAGIIVILVGL